MAFGILIKEVKEENGFIDLTLSFSGINKPGIFIAIAQMLIGKVFDAGDFLWSFISLLKKAK